jgi:hypothetical protein
MTGGRIKLIVKQWEMHTHSLVLKENLELES